MDIKGSLAIKLDAIGGGAKAQANYLNVENVKKSDSTYHLQVTVVNQRLVGENVTEFMPIKDVQPNQFQDVYGDCFISGFLEGGVFDALVLIELEDKNNVKNNVKNIGGELAIKASLAGGAVEIEGSGKGQKESSEKNTNDKMTITVSWFGGGDIIIKDVEQKGWAMETLKAVAISFADKVALCPQKTSAILTRYSSLRNFYEKSLHGSPLDYENAGVYSSSLLAPTWTTKRRGKSCKQCPAKSPKRKIEKPLPPNKLLPYAATVYGLDKAQRECRFEMIKIVREVDAVAEDPQVAVDPTRNNQYLSPIIFRQLILHVTKVDPVAMQKKIEELEVKIAAEAEELAKGREQLLSITAEKEALSTELESAKTSLQSATNGRNTLMSKNETLGDQLRDPEALAQALAKEKGKEEADLENRKSSEMIGAKEAELDATRQRLKGESETRVQRETERDDLKKKLEQESRAKGDVMAERVNLKGKLDQEAKTKAQLEEEFSRVKIQANPNWHEQNTLDQGFDGREVAFVNIASMSSSRPGICLAMDSDNQGVWKPFDIDSNYHRFKLERVDSQDRAAPWNIRSCESQNLVWYTANERIACSRHTGKMPGVDLWQIKKLRRQGYTIGNSYGCLEYKQNRPWLDMGYRDEMSSSQVWAILAL
ncbi:hypothetical protein LRP88_04137 [Fusarium phalaenopsidis]